jgi:hypothetical protein
VLCQLGEKFLVQTVKGTVTQDDNNVAWLKLGAEFFYDFGCRGFMEGFLPGLDEIGNEANGNEAFFGLEISAEARLRFPLGGLKRHQKLPLQRFLLHLVKQAEEQHKEHATDATP